MKKQTSNNIVYGPTVLFSCLSEQIDIKKKNAAVLTLPM